MTEQKMVKRAKVILRVGKSYTLAGRKYINGVPAYIKGSAVEEFKNNAHFNVTILDSVPAKKKKKKKSSDDSGTKKKSSDDSGTKKKSSSKKTSKKKVSSKKKTTKKKVKSKK